ncbi:MAG: hypothetical protein JJE46_00185, partial [Acidimicrobiia bacterium]|nr:hypothetical protein [Acidimicrobiia bacterium]
MYEDPFPDAVGYLPEVDVAGVNTEVMGGAVAHHGALIVRNLLEAGDVRRILEGMHRAQAQLDRPDGDDSDDESASW